MAGSKPVSRLTCEPIKRSFHLSARGSRVVGAFRSGEHGSNSVTGGFLPDNPRSLGVMTVSPIARARKRQSFAILTQQAHLEIKPNNKARYLLFSNYPTLIRPGESV
jgi:hypothetical protein